MPKTYVGSIDQGTTSSRFLIFDDHMRLVVGHQLEHKQITPQPGWLEHDPQEIFDNTCRCMVEAIQKLKALDSEFVQLAAVGITNQRETTVAWDRTTKNVLCNAIVWSDVRTSHMVQRLVKQHGSATFAAKKCGLPVSTYFSAMKMMWMLEHVPAVQEAASRDSLCFGTIDSWLIWKLTGETVHATDVTNASRTMLMNLDTLQWDASLCGEFRVPMGSLPQIKSCSEFFGFVVTNEDHLASVIGRNVPICGCIGDQQAALVGNLCFSVGQAKNTYGTGCFLLANVGNKPVHSKNGLLATVGYKLGSGAPCVYALEGAVAGAGSCMQWMRDRVGFFSSYAEIEVLSRSVHDAGGVVFVPAFSGLLAPHWAPEARGTIVGMTLQTSKAHIVRAALEAIALQVSEVVRAMERDSGTNFTILKVDGGLVKSNMLMENQADLLGIPVHVPSLLETTALGAAICAGLAVNVWRGVGDLENISELHSGVKVVKPMLTRESRELKYAEWTRALERAKGWAKL